MNASTLSNSDQLIALERLQNRQYRGDGQPHVDPLPDAYRYHEPYVAPTELRNAVNMALYLRRPLLLEGEPGAGKTRLAYAVAHELGYPLKEIYIRSTSQARDLLYTFDAVRRLYDIQERAAASVGRVASRAEEPKPVVDNADYVALGELGEAIRLAQAGVPSVVLIDEIDKADLDFPNDLLLVLDQLRFTVDELKPRPPAAAAEGYLYDALGKATREERRPYLPLVFITSNREKELPAPFLRRCLFYYIPFPQKTELQNILEAHLQSELTPLFAAALNHFWALRDEQRNRWRKPPSTSELLDWVRILEEEARTGRMTAEKLTATPANRLPHPGALLKNQDDLTALAGL